MTITAHFTKTGGEEGGGLPLTWIGVGIGIIIILIIGVTVWRRT